MYNKRSRKFKYFTISDLKFVTTKNDIVDESRKDSRRYVNILDITHYNEEVILCDDTFQMRRLRNNGTFENISLSLTNDKLMFYSIHAANDNDIIVGFTNTQRNSTGFLELRDINYASKVRRVECDCGSDKKLFTLPKKITTDINGDIFVIDQLAYSKRVVSIGKWGQSKWTYSGHQSLNRVSSAEEEEVQVLEDAKRNFNFRFREHEDKEGDFFPNDIVTTSSGLVLVSEKTTNAIHVLSKDGQFICNCLSDGVIIAPVSICFNKKGQLMIGCSDSGKTKLHIVKFIE